MKIKSRIFTLLLAVIMIVGTSIPSFAANSLGVTYELTLTPETVEVSSSTQTVTMEINASREIDWDGIQAKFYLPEGFKLTSITNKEVTLKPADINVNPDEHGFGSLGFQSESGENEKITNICLVTYEIAANTPAGTYKLGVEQLEITKDYGEIWESEGIVTKDFVITSGGSTPPAPVLTPVSVPTAKTGLVYTGSQQQGVADGEGYTLTGHKAEKAGNYKATATLESGYKWDDDTTNAKEISWTIAKADPAYSIPTGLTGTKDKALSSITLPTGWQWKAPTTVMNTTGNQTFAAIYTPTDTENYNTKEENLTVAVSEPPVTHPAKPVIDVTGTYTYNGADQTASVTGYDSTTMDIAGNVGKNAGNYTVSVTSKTGKWADGSTDAVTKMWKIEKADPAYSVPTGLTGTKDKALSSITLPTGWQWKAPTTVMNTTGNQTFAAIYTPTDTENYNTKEENLTVAVSEPPVTDPAKPVIDVTGTYTYNGADQTASVTGYDSTTMDIAGNVGKDAGNYTVSVTSKTGKWADGSTDAVTKTWTIAKAIPTGTPIYTPITTSEKTLADAALTADFSVPGTVKWIADDGSDLPDTTTVAANTYYKWLFTPTDTANYETLTDTIRLYRKSTGGSGGSATRYTVSFETNGGSKIASQNVKRNTLISEPTAPTKENFDFAGWYTDKELKTKYDFADRVTKSITLYAKWTEKDNTINQIILTIGKKDAKVFGKTISNDVAPKIVNDRTMLPARFVAENLGATVSWDGEKELVTIKGKNEKNEDVTILITIGAANAVVNGKEVKLDSPAFLENDRTYTPIRFISEQLGATVDWDNENQKVTITKMQSADK